MDPMTLFLAQVFGPTLFVLSIALFVNRSFYTRAFQSIGDANLASFMSMFAMISVGMVLVLNHFLWGSLPEILVSILALGFLVKGSLWALFPAWFDRITQSVLSSRMMGFASGVWLLGGLYLVWVGFFA